MNLDTIVESCLAPIPGDSPVGQDARYDPKFDAVKTEIMKMTAMAVGEQGIQWKTIVEGSADLLSNTTKDLKLCGYLAFGLLKQENYPGLSVGLSVMLGIMDQYWDDMFPAIRRLKARAQVFDWLDDRLSPLVETIEPSADQIPTLHECADKAQELTDKVQSLINIPVTGFSQLRSRLGTWTGKYPLPKKEEPKPQAEQPAPQEQQTESAAAAQAQPAATQSPTQTTAPASSGGMAPVDVPDKVENIEEGINALRQVTHLVRGADAGSPVSYRVARVIKWDTLTDLPPAEASGQTQIPGPRDDQVDSMKAMLGASNWKDLTEEAESTFLSPAGTFWLDLHRYVVKGLAGQGFADTAAQVEMEVGRLINRLPGLAEMSFASGQPFADASTRQWLAEAAAKAAGPGTGSQVDTEEKKWIGEAVDKAEKNDLPGAMARIQKAIAEAPGYRKSLERRLAASNLCLDFGKNGFALPILEYLDTAIEKTVLADWDPEFCSEVWAKLVAAYQTQNGSGELTDEQKIRMNEARSRLFRTNLAKAAAIWSDETQPD